jgi:hypothetical protein
MQKKVYLLYPSYPPGMIHFNGPHIMHLPKKKKTNIPKRKPLQRGGKKKGGGCMPALNPKRNEKERRRNGRRVKTTAGEE